MTFAVPRGWRLYEGLMPLTEVRYCQPCDWTPTDESLTKRKSIEASILPGLLVLLQQLFRHFLVHGHLTTTVGSKGTPHSQM